METTTNKHMRWNLRQSAFAQAWRNLRTSLSSRNRNSGMLNFTSCVKAMTGAEPGAEAGIARVEDETDETDETFICYICLDSDPRGLVRPCGCPKHVHRRCLAKWQLRCAGKHEETSCRFCKEVLPDWRSELTPGGLDLTSPVHIVMAVILEGVEHRFNVEPGDDGRKKFESAVRTHFDVAQDHGLEFTFECNEPPASAPDVSQSACDAVSRKSNAISLDGVNAYDAAFHCASITAAMRTKRAHL